MEYYYRKYIVLLFALTRHGSVKVNCSSENPIQFEQILDTLLLSSSYLGLFWHEAYIPSAIWSSHLTAFLFKVELIYIFTGATQLCCLRVDGPGCAQCLKIH